MKGIHVFVLAAIVLASYSLFGLQSAHKGGRSASQPVSAASITGAW